MHVSKIYVGNKQLNAIKFCMCVTIFSLAAICESYYIF